MLAIVLQVAGATLISLGAGLVYPPAGVILAGLFAVGFGIALERGRAE